MRAPTEAPADWISVIDMGVPPWTKRASRLGSTTIHFSHSGAQTSATKWPLKPFTASVSAAQRAGRPTDWQALTKLAA